MVIGVSLLDAGNDKDSDLAHIDCVSSQPGIAPQIVEIKNTSDEEVSVIRRLIDVRLSSGGQVSDAVAVSFEAAIKLCPNANPSDLWHHVIYRHLLNTGWSDQRWKRVCGFALERALVAIFNPRLAEHNLRFRIVSGPEARSLLDSLGVTGVPGSKIDVFLESKARSTWTVFGAAHVKASIAERIQDDVPASIALMQRGLVSIGLTMDAKSYPPPHGNCINYGELGGRSVDVVKTRIKRDYVERDGQFDALFSFNLRTPPSPEQTKSGSRIWVSGLAHQHQNELIEFLASRQRAVRS